IPHSSPTIGPLENLGTPLGNQRLGVPVARGVGVVRNPGSDRGSHRPHVQIRSMSRVTLAPRAVTQSIRQVPSAESARATSARLRRGIGWTCRLTQEGAPAELRIASRTRVQVGRDGLTVIFSICVRWRFWILN